MRHLCALVAAGALLVTVAGCASTGPPTVARVGPGWSETGIASWYGTPFHGRRTASGEVYDMEAMTAAHPWLPFGTLVRVQNRENGRAARVRINDRGPFKAGRIIDVSRAAARELRMLGPGTARVRLVVVRMSAGPDCLELQVGAFQDPANARAALRKLTRAGFGSRLEATGDGLLRVLAGPFGDLRSLRKARSRFGGFARACPSE